MKYYTELIHVTLAKKLKEKGMSVEIVNDNTVEHDFPIEEHCETTYAEVFDWLLEKGLSCEIYGRGSGYDYVICKDCPDCTRGTRLAFNDYEGPNDGACWDSWCEAANAAIEKALTLIKRNEL